MWLCCGINMHMDSCLESHTERTSYWIHYCSLMQDAHKVLLYLMNTVCHFLPCRIGSPNNLPMLVTWKEVICSLYVIHSYNVNPTGTSCVIHVLNTIPSRSTNQDNSVTSYLHDVHHEKQSPTLVLFSEEVLFHLRGHVDFQNNQNWSAENPVLIH